MYDLTSRVLNLPQTVTPAMSLVVSIHHTSVPLEPEVKKSTDGYVVHRLLGAVLMDW
jgi:hypothetical protein